MISSFDDNHKVGVFNIRMFNQQDTTVELIKKVVNSYHNIFNVHVNDCYDDLSPVHA